MLGRRTVSELYVVNHTPSFLFVVLFLTAFISTANKLYPDSCNVCMYIQTSCFTVTTKLTAPPHGTYDRRTSKGIISVPQVLYSG